MNCSNTHLSCLNIIRGFSSLGFLTDRKPPKGFLSDFYAFGTVVDIELYDSFAFFVFVFVSLVTEYLSFISYFYVFRERELDPSMTKYFTFKIYFDELVAMRYILDILMFVIVICFLW